MIVTHIGRKTGAIRKTPLMTVKAGGGYVLIGSYGGAPKDPAVAAEIFGEQGWVAIDASRVTGPVVDVSRGVPAHVPGHNCMFCNSARAHQEVLIQGAPPGAVTRMID